MLDSLPKLHCCRRGVGLIDGLMRWINCLKIKAGCWFGQQKRFTEWTEGLTSEVGNFFFLSLSPDDPTDLDKVAYNHKLACWLCHIRALVTFEIFSGRLICQCSQIQVDKSYDDIMVSDDRRTTLFFCYCVLKPERNTKSHILLLLFVFKTKTE